MANDSNKLLTEIYIVLLVFASGALSVALYHCISMLWWDLHRHRRRRGLGDIQLPGNDISLDNSVAGLIPAHKHKKVTSRAEDGDEPMCAVCLSEFEDGDELRTLPDCKHSFHVECIDMWLCSHGNCPVCRMDATPSVEVVCVLEAQAQHEGESTMTQDLVVPSIWQFDG